MILFNKINLSLNPFPSIIYYLIFGCIMPIIQMNQILKNFAFFNLLTLFFLNVYY